MKAAKNNNQGTTKNVLSESKKTIPSYFQIGTKPVVAVVGGSLTSPVVGGSLKSLTEFVNTKPMYVEVLKKTLADRDAVAKSSLNKEQDESNKMPDESEKVGDESNKEPDELLLAVAEGCGNILNNSFEVDVCENANVSPECAGCLERDKKYKDLMKLYLKSTHRYSELDHNYRDLLQTKTRSNQPEPDDTAASSNDVFTPNEVKYLQSMPLSKTTDSTFILKCLEYAYKADPSVLRFKYLQSMPLSKTTDSTFILKCLEYAYKADPSVLRFKTLKGKSESVQYDDNGNMEQIAKKDPLTPTKVDRIKELFIERLSKCKIDSVAFGYRIKDSNVNRLFATGIINVSKKSK